MADNEDLDSPPSHDLLNVFAAADLSSQSSYDSVKYKRAWHRAKGIRSSILSSGEFPGACSRALSIALNHKEISSIMAVTGTILPKQYANVITRHEQKKKTLSHATSIGNKRKQAKDRKTFFISNIVSIVSSQSKKTDQNEVNAIHDLLQCSRSSAYRQQTTASTKRGHLIAQVKNTSVKWSIKPCIVRTKKVRKALRKETVDWIMKDSNVRQSPITCDTLLIADADTTFYFSICICNK